MPRNAVSVGLALLAGVLFFCVLIFLGSKPIGNVITREDAASSAARDAKVSAQTLYESFLGNETSFSATYGQPLTVSGKMWMAEVEADDVVLVMADENNRPIVRARMRRGDWEAVANLSSGSQVSLKCGGAIARGEIPYLLNCALASGDTNDTTAR